MDYKRELIRFDWAIKKLLRDKANFGILEGFLSELLKDNITIIEILDSESNKESESDKHNRVDLLVKDKKGDFIIIEVQNSKEYDYFHRILYGTAKVIAEHIKKGEPYSEVKKVISITIAYFDLGQGKDYLYHGKNEFRGVHFKDKLRLAPKQKDLYNKKEVFEIFPEYWLIKVEKFKEEVHSKIDEWIYFLKTGEIEQDFSAQGIQEAKDKLDTFKLSPEERIQYNYYLKRLMDEASAHYNKMIDFEEYVEKLKAKSIEQGIKKGLEEGLEKGLEQGLEKGLEQGLEKGLEQGLEKGEEKKEREAVVGMDKNGISETIIASALNISIERVREILKQVK